MKGTTRRSAPHTVVAGLAVVEDRTPRNRLDLLLTTGGIRSILPCRQIEPMLAETQSRIWCAQQSALVRLHEAQKQMAVAQKEAVLAPAKKDHGFRQKLKSRWQSSTSIEATVSMPLHMLDAAHNHMIGEDNHVSVQAATRLRARGARTRTSDIQNLSGIDPAAPPS